VHPTPRSLHPAAAGDTADTVGRDSLGRNPVIDPSVTVASVDER
jgi:hypothetical protein